MRIRLPGERRTWAKYIGELLIVGIGVALGLSATEWAAARRTKADVQDARLSLNRELATNFESVRFRDQIQPCVSRRLEELQQWTARQRLANNGRLPFEIGRPGWRIMRTSVWDVTKAGEVASKMPLDDRLEYAQAYDFLENFERLLREDAAIWLDIGYFAGTSDLTAVELRQLRGLVSRAKAYAEALAANHREIVPHLNQMGIKSDTPLPAGHAARKALCQPLAQR